MDMNNGGGFAWGYGGCYVEGGKEEKIRAVIVSVISMKYNLQKEKKESKACH